MPTYNLLRFITFAILWYGMWLLVYPVFFFLPLIIVLLYLMQKQYRGGLAIRSSLSVACAVPYLLQMSGQRLLAGKPDPVPDFLLLLTWSVIGLFWVVNLALATLVARARRRAAQAGKQMEQPLP